MRRFLGYYITICGLTIAVMLSYSGFSYRSCRPFWAGLQPNGLLMTWDWDANPIYESERIHIDVTNSPLVVYRYKLPRQITDDETRLVLGLADFHLERNLPYLALVTLQRGSGIIPLRQRQMFADWLEDRCDQLNRVDCSAVILVPEAIFRAVLRVVYRFREPPMRTITAADHAGAAAAVVSELERMGEPITAEIEAVLRRLGSW